MFLSVKNNNEKNRKKIGFKFLFQVFRKKIIFHFFLAVMMVALNWCLNSINRELFEDASVGSNHVCATSNCQSHTVSPVGGNAKHRVSSISDSSLSSVVDEGYGKYLPFWDY